jgi:thymidylate synthase
MIMRSLIPHLHQEYPCGVLLSASTSMFSSFDGETADDLWRKVSRALVSGQGRTQEGRRSKTLEVLHALLCLHDPRQRWVLSRVPAMNPAFALAEVVWLLNGHRDARFLNYWNRRLPEFAGRSAIYHGAYGYRLRAHFGIDQIERAAEALHANPDGRQVVLEIWDPGSDLPYPDGSPRDADIPCNVCALLKVREGKLEWLQVTRSNDLFLGLPHNLVQFTTLQEVLAGWIGVGVGEYHQISDSLHIYHEDLKNIEQSLVEPASTEAYVNNDSVALSATESGPLLRELDSRARAMTEDKLAPADLSWLVTSFTAPVGLRNWLIVLGAEAARRRRWPDAASELIGFCTNAALSRAWERWCERHAQSLGRVPVGRHVVGASGKVSG